MKTKVDCVPLGSGAVEGKLFSLMLPKGADIVRAGVEPGSGLPVMWVAYATGNHTDERFFVSVRDGATLLPDADNEPVFQHRGMWWEGTVTFHLFERIAHSGPKE